MSHKPLRRSSCYVLPETNMVSSNHSNNDPASIQSIASTAISHIQQLVSLVEQGPTAASTSSNELVLLWRNYEGDSQQFQQGQAGMLQQEGMKDPILSDRTLT